MKKLLFICLLLAGCNKSEHDLNTTFTIDPALQKPDISILKNDTITHKLCSQWKDLKEVNALVEGSIRKLHSARAIKNQNALDITITDCSYNLSHYLDIQLADSAFIITHRITDDLGEYNFVPTYQKLTVKEYPLQVGDTIVGELDFRGIALVYGQTIKCDFKGTFMTAVTSKK